MARPTKSKMQKELFCGAGGKPRAPDKDAGAELMLASPRGGQPPIFYPGGHGPMWDLAEDKNSIALIEDFYNAGKPVAAVCHGPAVLHRVTYEGEPIVK